MRKGIFIISIVLLLTGNGLLSAATYEQTMYGDQAWHSTKKDDTPGSGPQSTVDNSAHAKLGAESSKRNLDEIKKNNSNVPEGNDPTDTITNAEDAIRAANQNKNVPASDTTKTLNQNKNTDKRNSKNSDSSGDPVRITNGIYEQNECDFSTTGFSISRKYESDNSIVSSMGYGWVFNLDERIILGNETSDDNLVSRQETYISELEQIIINLENQLAQDYCVTSVYSAQAEIMYKITLCNYFLQECLKLQESLTQLDYESEGYEINADIKDYINQNEELTNSLITKINMLMRQYASVEENLAFLENLKQNYKAEQLILTELSKSDEKTTQIKKRNSKVVFPGMQPFYEETGENTITLVDSEGYPHLFYKENDVWKNYDDNNYLRCEKNGECFTAYETSGFIKHFDEAGFVVKICDRNSNEINIVRDENERIKYVETAFGEFFDFSYSGSYISKIVNRRAPEQNFVYSYSGNKLTGVKDCDGDSVSMNYDENGRMIFLNKCDGSCISFSYGEQDSEGRIFATSTTNEEGFAEHFIYDRNGKHTDYIDHDGNKTSYWFDDKHRTIREERADGTVILNDYDEKGNKTFANYNDNTSETWTYGSFNLVTSYTDRAGISHEYIYDSKGNPVEYRKDGKTVNTQSFDERGFVTQSVQYGENQLVTNYIYDDYGNLIEESEAGKVIQYEYDSQNRVTKIKLNGRLISSFKYERRCTERLDYNGLKTIMLTNGRKDITELIYIDEQTGAMHKTRLEYDKRHLPLKVFKGDGETEKLTASYLYTPEGKLRGEAAHGDESWIKIYEYQNGEISEMKLFSVAENPVNLSDFQSLLNSAGENVYIQKYENQNIATSEDQTNQPEIKKIWYEYDDLDRVIKLIGGNSSDEASACYLETYDYSADGRNITITEGSKYKIQIELDAFGNIIRQTDGNGNQKSFDYDYQNYLTAEYDGYGNKISYEYNALGKVSSIVYADGTKEIYKYNYMGALEKITDDCGIVYSVEYDRSGKLIKEKSRADSEKSYEYDNSDRLTAIYCGNEILEAYKYENDNKRVIVRNGRNPEYIYNYDESGRLINERNRNGLEQNYTYDNEGNLQTKIDFSGAATNIAYSYDRTKQTVSYSDGSQNIFSYDAIGNIIEAANSYGKTIYQYDKGGRLIYQKDITTGEEVCFEYDAAGNKTKLLSSNREIVYIYGKNNELKEIFDNKQRLSVKLKYDINGREVLRKFGNGTSEKTLYDKAGRVIVKMQKSDREELLWGEGYVYGSDGKRTASVDNHGRVTFYEYNNKGQLKTVYYPGEGENRFLTAKEKSELIPLLNAMQYGLAYNLPELHSFVKETYTYDSDGNIISKATSSGQINYSYDNENCLISSDSNEQSIVNYSYDKNGNLLTEESELKSVRYVYNSQNRLIYCEVTDNAEKTYSQSSYAYDAFGRRLLVQDNGETALRTLYDGFTFDEIKQSPTFANGLFTDSEETGIKIAAATGNPTGDRYRYLDENTYRPANNRYRGVQTSLRVNGSIAAQSTFDYGVEYYSTDLLGSVRSSTDSSGSAKSSYTYDAFGSLVQGDLNSASPYGYLGKPYDSTSSLYNYGYRDYNPATARFTTIDPIRDGTNWFSYCNGDPVNFVDLWGLETGDNRLTNYDAVMRAIQGMDLRNGVPSDFIFKNTIFNSSNTLNQLQLDKALGIQSDSRTTQSCQTTAIINAYAINLKNGISGKEIKKALMNKEGALIDSLDKDGSPIVLNEVSKALAKSTGNNMYLKSMDTKIEINGFMDISVGVILGYSKNNDTDSHFGYKNTYITIDSMDPNRPAAQNYTENTYRLLYWSNM